MLHPALPPALQDLIDLNSFLGMQLARLPTARQGRGCRFVRTMTEVHKTLSLVVARLEAAHARSAYDAQGADFCGEPAEEQELCFLLLREIEHEWFLEWDAELASLTV